MPSVAPLCTRSRAIGDAAAGRVDAGEVVKYAGW